MRHIDLIVGDLPDLTPVRVENGRDGIVVIRNGDRVAAFEDRCPHAQWRLSDGEIVGGVLECPGHGWEFCPATGRCVTVPAYALTPVSVERIGGSVRLAIASAETTALGPCNGELG
jgi:nitrite reductase/ring-hydroxylating ferredoxin subunit